MVKFKKKFWYESNACWGWIETMQDLIEKCHLQIDPKYGGLQDVDQFLDRSEENPIDPDEDRRFKREYLDFGTRREHNGDRTLRMYLKEIGMLKAFLEAFNEPEKFSLNIKLNKIKNDKE